MAPAYQVPDNFRNLILDQPVDGPWSEDDENGYYEDPEPGTEHERSSRQRSRPRRASTINSTGTIRTNPSPHRTPRRSNHRDVGDARPTAPPSARRRQLTNGTTSSHDDRWQGSSVQYAGEQMAQFRHPAYYTPGPAPPNLNPMMSPLQGMRDPFSAGPYPGTPYQGGGYPAPTYQTPPNPPESYYPPAPMRRMSTHQPTPRERGVFEPTSSPATSRPGVRFRSSSTSRPSGTQARGQAERRPPSTPPTEPRIEPKFERLEQENQALRASLEQERRRREAQHRRELEARRHAEEEAERNRRLEREHRERNSQPKTRRSGSRGAPTTSRGHAPNDNHNDSREARPRVTIEVKEMEGPPPGPTTNEMRMEDQQRQARNHMATNELRGLLGGYSLPRDLEMQRNLDILAQAQLLAAQQARQTMVPTAAALLDQLRIGSSWNGSQVPGMAMAHQPDLGYVRDSSGHQFAAVSSLLSKLVDRVDSVDQKVDTLRQSQQRLAIEGELLDDDESYRSPVPSRGVRSAYRGSDLGDPESNRSRASTGSVFSDPRSTAESGISRAQSSARGGGGGTATRTGEHRRSAVSRPLHQDPLRVTTRPSEQPQRSERYATPGPPPYPPSTSSSGQPMPAYVEDIHDEDWANEASRRGPRTSARRFPDGRTEIGSQTQRRDYGREGLRRAETANTSSRRREPSVAPPSFLDGDDDDASDDDDDEYPAFDRAEFPRRRTSGVYPRAPPAVVPDAPNPLKTKTSPY
ncbi:hypothetical protein B0T19DRAFT_435496 [Cercophora scortea]|uniref:Uncharacterized protein n=1 Tax=Cercophora scortea TaxID=314031 RepID=A0AAE0I364_9PEZI|nr:hypothetical protein B0T19DRAFT_435496 [Cercophora scortea]